MKERLHVCYRVFLFKQKTAYELRISDCSSDVCSSDLRERRGSVKAASMDDARDVLGARKLYVVRMEPGSGASAPPLLSRRALFRKKLSAKQGSVERRVHTECVRMRRTLWLP